MTPPIDNVKNLPVGLDRLAFCAKQAMEEFQTALITETAGRQDAIRAIIEYGQSLNEGRNSIGSDKKFSEWVKAEGLDRGKPWDSRQERTSAMQLSRAAGSGTIAATSFEGCPNSRPSHIMSWYRKTHGKPPVTRAKKVSQSTKPEAVAKPKVTVAQARKDEQALAMTGLTETGKTTVAEAVRAHKARIEKNFEQRVGEEVRQRIATANDFVRKEYAELKKVNAGLEKMLQNHGVFTPIEYRQLLMVCHPDNSASSEVRARILDIVVKNEVFLIKRR